MNACPLVLPLLFVLPGVAVSQEMPEPAPEQQRYAPLIGNWHGTGTAQMGPGEPARWESHSTYAWALGDFFVQEDTILRFEGMPEPLAMRVYHGWDVEHGHHVALGGYMRRPCVQRMVMEFDADGAPTKAVGHTILGANEPYVSWSATYGRE